ncbi:MAG: hypothetical protein F2874_01355, partial [Actinobacteria bacterium]|nr:hypothetical protein [Actinomycetota bacterium]
MERGNEGHRRCPVLITADTRLVEAVMRLAAAAAVDVEVVSDLEGARRLWASAPLIIVGADLARDLAHGTPSRRAGVVLVGAGSVEGHESTSEIWREAVSIGAEHVVQLPDAGGWLIQR